MPGHSNLRHDPSLDTGFFDRNDLFESTNKSSELVGTGTGHANQRPALPPGTCAKTLGRIVGD